MRSNETKRRSTPGDIEESFDFKDYEAILWKQTLDSRG